MQQLRDAKLVTRVRERLPLDLEPDNADQSISDRVSAAKIAYRNENSERRTQWTGEGSKFTRTWVDRSLVLIWLQRSVRQRLKYPVATGIGSGSQYGCAERTVPGTAIACPMIEFGPKACPSGSPTLDLCLQIQAAAPWHPGTHCVSQAVAQVEAAMPVGPSLGVLFRSDSVQCRAFCQKPGKLEAAAEAMSGFGEDGPGWCGGRDCLCGASLAHLADLSPDLSLPRRRPHPDPRYFAPHPGRDCCRSRHRAKYGRVLWLDLLAKADAAGLAYTAHPRLCTSHETYSS